MRKLRCQENLTTEPEPRYLTPVRLLIMWSAASHWAELRIWPGFGSQEHSGIAAEMVDSLWSWRGAHNTEPGKVTTSENSHPGSHSGRTDTMPPTATLPTPAAGSKGSSRGS